MKLTQIIIATLLLSSASVLAEGKKGEMLAKAKAMASENIDAKISLLNSLKSCINGANDRSALKECRKQAKSKRQSLKESNKARRQQMKEERQKRRAERKKNKEK